MVRGAIGPVCNPGSMVRGGVGRHLEGSTRSRAASTKGTHAMKKIILGTVLIVATLAAPLAYASSNNRVSEEQQKQIRERLTVQGYDVRKIDSEDGQIEVYVIKDGKKLELYLDQNLEIVRTKTDD